ncbi:NAD-dependent epimerase/dehydratase family protein [Breznakiellaceae bacterium SP9]
MKALFIGGSGTISAAITRRVLEQGWELCLLNRGNRTVNTTEAERSRLTSIQCDINAEPELEISAKLEGETFDVVADFIAFTPNQVERDFRLFNGRTRQYITLSTASAYQKPLVDLPITESTPLANPFWEYSRNKIAIEDVLNKYYQEDGFPITIVRPSHTYDERSVPLGVHGKSGSWQVLKRIIDGKRVIIHGDGTSLWTITHNSDFAAAFEGLMGNIHALGQTVGITSDETLTWNQIYQTLADAVDKPLRAVHISSEFLSLVGPYNFLGGLIGDKANSVLFDNSKLKRLVPGFQAKVRFDQGVRQTIAYVRSHPECQRNDPDFDAWCDRLIAARDTALDELRAAP